MNDALVRPECDALRPDHIEVLLGRAMRELADGTAGRRIVREARLAVALHMAELAARPGESEATP